MTMMTAMNNMMENGASANYAEAAFSCASYHGNDMLILDAIFMASIIISIISMISIRFMVRISIVLVAILIVLLKVQEQDTPGLRRSPY